MELINLMTKFAEHVPSTYFRKSSISIVFGLQPDIPQLVSTSVICCLISKSLGTSYRNPKCTYNRLMSMYRWDINGTFTEHTYVCIMQ